MSGTGDKSQIARNRDKQEMEYSQVIYTYFPDLLFIEEEKKVAWEH